MNVIDELAPIVKKKKTLTMLLWAVLEGKSWGLLKTWWESYPHVDPNPVT
jgi:hypothetical protein